MIFVLRALKGEVCARVIAIKPVELRSDFDTVG